jgi:hypothetical protein
MAGGCFLKWGYPTPPCFDKRVRKRLKTKDRELKKSGKSAKESVSN